MGARFIIFFFFLLFTALHGRTSHQGGVEGSYSSRKFSSLMPFSFPADNPKSSAAGDSSENFSPIPGSTLAFAPDPSPPEMPAAALPPASAPGTLLHPPPPPAARQSPPPPAPMGRPMARLWCVAKPAVPSEKLQEAMDYACGAADCGEIQRGGRCFFPDEVVAHASYAFNSYWQKWKRSGGTCDFDGAAIVVTTDPSFLQCHYALSS